MTNLVYRRASTDKQTTERQTHVLAEAGLTEGAEGVHFFEDPATSSKIPALKRKGFEGLASYARPGDTLTVSELYRLCRDLDDILSVRKWCQDKGVKLRVLSGALSGIVDLAASDSTTTMLVNVVVSVGQFQRDLQRELTIEGVAAARAQGRMGGRRPAVKDVEAVREDFQEEGLSIAALSRKYGVSRGAVRTALEGLLPGRSAEEAAVDLEETDGPEGEWPGQMAVPVDAPPVKSLREMRAERVAVIDMPGKVADFLNVDETAPMEEGTATRAALLDSKRINRGKGYSLRVTAPLSVHRELLEWAWTLAGGEGLESDPGEVKAYRTYADRIEEAAKAF